MAHPEIIPVNPRLELLQPYPFERLRALFSEPWMGPAAAPEHARVVDLSIGEPRHPAPEVVRAALSGALDGLSNYPATAGSPALRTALAQWIGKRHGLTPDAEREVLPVNGSREALFAFAQVVVRPSPAGEPPPVVLAPNPFYQIYEGAALLAGAETWLIGQEPERQFRCDWSAVPEDVWARTQLLFVCSPGNPTGAVMDLDEWRHLFERADRYGFVIASDECYSEIHFDEAHPPLGGIGACRALGRSGMERLVVFSSLSKRSNVPGLRSGFVAGDRRWIEAFLRYRTYHGCAMGPAVQAASIACWNDEAHVLANRALYREKFDAVLAVLGDTGLVTRPDAGFYLWLAVPDGDDLALARRLRHQYQVVTLPGSYLGRDIDDVRHGWPVGANPGAGRVRLALVAEAADCIEGAHRIRAALQTH